MQVNGLVRQKYRENKEQQKADMQRGNGLREEPRVKLRDSKAGGELIKPKSITGMATTGHPLSS